ncbi:Lipopolysaccharide-binding protein [Toxocara canis]|uniref:Lipopolysaccharide-binding protein n=1 Tax=Toxocara canis TaxID=6265 RepID=A0A0B2VYG5_TOXCA|nr:Lipopolysaccharide-binding protein [Toxocara canis]
MQFACAVFVSAALLRAAAIARRPEDVHPLLEKHSSTGSALRIRLLPSAVQYLNQIGARIIAEQLPRLLIPNISHRLTNDQGIISLSRVRVSRFKRASIHNISTSSPNRLTWVMRNLNIGLIGDLSGEVNIVVPLKLEGQAEIQTEGVDFRLESALEKSPSGSARVRTISCRTSIKAVRIDNHNGGLAGIALNLFKMAISEHIRPLIQMQICKKVTRFIDEDLNEKLARAQTKSSLATAAEQNSIGRHLGLPDAKHILTRFKSITLNASSLFGEVFCEKGVPDEWNCKNVLATVYMHVRLIGDLSGEVNIVVPLKLEGQAEIQTEGVDFRLESALEKSPSGSARVRTISCRTSIKAVRIDNHNGGLAGIALNLFKNVIGDLSGEVNIVVPLKLEGQAEIQTEGVDFRLESALEKSPSGSARVRTISCRTSIKAVRIDNHNGGLAGIALNLFKMAISEHIRPLIQMQICKKVTRFIDEDLNEKLARAQTKSSLATAAEQNSIGRHLGLPDAKHILTRFKSITLNASSLFGEQIATKIFIDYRLTEDPICYTNTVELANLGHVSIGNQQSYTPFGVPPLRWPLTVKDNAMVDVLVSDYVPNALLYHAFRERLLKFVIDDRTTSSLSAFLRTSCTSDSVCFADVLPQLAEQFPNSKLQLVIVATRAPTVIMSARNGGVISLNLNGLIFIYVLNGNSTRRQAAVFELGLVADTNLQVQNSTVLGKVTLSRFHLSKRSGNIDISNDEVTDLTLLSSEMLQKFVNNMLHTGFPIPIPQVVHLTASDLQILDRCAFLSSRFTLDHRRISDIASTTIFSGQPFSQQ